MAPSGLWHLCWAWCGRRGGCQRGRCNRNGVESGHCRFPKGPQSKPPPRTSHKMRRRTQSLRRTGDRSPAARPPDSSQTCASGAMQPGSQPSESPVKWANEAISRGSVWAPETLEQGSRIDGAGGGSGGSGSGRERLLLTDGYGLEFCVCGRSSRRKGPIPTMYVHSSVRYMATPRVNSNVPTVPTGQTGKMRMSMSQAC